MSLTAHVRSIAGVDSDTVADSVIDAALAANRVWVDEPVEWLTRRVGRATVWGVLEGVEVIDAAGEVVDQEDAGVVIDASGGVLLDTDGEYPAWSIRGWGFDVFAAAASVCDAAAASTAGAYDFTSDGDSFSRSQQARAYASAADRFRRLALPRTVRATGARRDDGVTGRTVRRADR